MVSEWCANFDIADPLFSHVWSAKGYQGMVMGVNRQGVGKPSYPSIQPASSSHLPPQQSLGQRPSRGGGIFRSSQYLCLSGLSPDVSDDYSFDLFLKTNILDSTFFTITLRQKSYWQNIGRTIHNNPAILV